ncbi:MAG: threonine-phosphate decarboxylase CobD [Pseudomonadota bacterium]|nr:threonine-phosphate decarboxylase CobD [Pseudomonadota bacterium]
MVVSESPEGSRHDNLDHGGQLRRAARHYGIALEHWLDLSTGINPNGWPVPAIPSRCWARLPEQEDGLESAARQYYQTDHILPVAGSQAAIQLLPRLRSQSRVAVPEPGYGEHRLAWHRGGHRVSAVDPREVDAIIKHTDVLILIHPNNPSGIGYSRQQLFSWHQSLVARGGWLVVDEAFMDTTPEASLCGYSARNGLIVLRSLGKFFGLAGARVGFVCAHPDLLRQLENLAGPWDISGPSRWVASTALQDQHWQRVARRQLAAASHRLQSLLREYHLAPAGSCALFQWVCTPLAPRIYETLAQQGILTRLYLRPSSLRIGLPGTEDEWHRLRAALEPLAL